MKPVLDYFRELGRATVAGWNRFWFTPTDAATLGLIRILAGLMLFYTHAVWTLNLEQFLGDKPWVNATAAARFYDRGGGPDIAEAGPAATPAAPSVARTREPPRCYAWSYFWLISSPGQLWTVHIVALAVFFMLTVGLFTNVAKVLAWLATVAYVNRLPGALFGLDQINVLLVTYLMVGPCGAAYSLDRVLRGWKAGQPLSPVTASVGANVSIRLIQLHMCIIYLFAGLSKLSGESWWDGTALWGAMANLEYQSIDMTWLANYEMVVNAMTHVTVIWETSFCALVWPRLTRPLVLFLAIPLHLGIAFCMGMITFGLVMLIGCTAFVSPWVVRRLLERRSAEGRAGEGREPQLALPERGNGQDRVARRPKAVNGGRSR